MVSKLVEVSAGHSSGTTTILNLLSTEWFPHVKSVVLAGTFLNEKVTKSASWYSGSRTQKRWYPYIMSDNNQEASKTTTSDVAQWMLSVIQEQGELTQNNAFYEINKRFGRSFTTIASSGSPSIKGSVLTAFRKISDDIVIWERGDKKWRKREFYDAPGREQ